MSIRVDKGSAELWPKTGRLLDAREIQEAVRKAGFTPNGIEATLTGQISSDGGKMVLAVGESGESVILRGESKLKELPEEKLQRVVVTGRLESELPEGHHGHPSVLHLRSFKLIESTAGQ